jgi:hypothetical protein
MGGLWRSIGAIYRQQEGGEPDRPSCSHSLPFAGALVAGGLAQPTALKIPNPGLHHKVLGLPKIIKYM